MAVLTDRGDSMKILIADSNKSRLDVLSAIIGEFFPNGQITAETDSLMAGKDCFSETFDVVFANLDDRRLDGLKLREFVRRSNPKAKYYLCGNEHDLYDWNIIDEEWNICEDGVDGAVSYPVTKNKIARLLNLRIFISDANCTADTEPDNGLTEQAARSDNRFYPDKLADRQLDEVSGGGKSGVGEIIRLSDYKPDKEYKIRDENGTYVMCSEKEIEETITKL